MTGTMSAGLEVVALSGPCARLKSSADIDTADQPLTQQGDPVLRGCACLAAEISRHYDPELRAFHRRLTTRGEHYKQAPRALAAKILTRCFALLRDQRECQVAHREQLARTCNEEGKAVRESVHEVTERLNDGNGMPSPATEAKPMTTWRQRLVGTATAIRKTPTTTPESSLAAAERGLSGS